MRPGKRLPLAEDSELSAMASNRPNRDPRSNPFFLSCARLLPWCRMLRKVVPSLVVLERRMGGVLPLPLLLRDTKDFPSDDDFSSAVCRMVRNAVPSLLVFERRMGGMLLLLLLLRDRTDLPSDDLSSPV